MKPFILLLFLVASVATPAKEISPGSDIAVVSSEELARLRLGRELAPSEPISLTIPASLEERQAAIATQGRRLTTSLKPVDAVELRTNLLLGSSPKGTGGRELVDESNDPPPVALFLNLNDEKIVLAVVDTTYDVQRDMRHVTAALLTEPKGYARFTIDKTGAIVATVIGAKHSYRLLTAGQTLQLAYLLPDRTSDQTPAHRLIADAGSAIAATERRHAQIELLSNIAPSRIRIAKNDASASVVGGDLGSILEVPATTAAIMRVLKDLYPVTNATGTEVLEIIEERGGRVASHGRVIRFQQLIDNIPVWRRNEFRLNGEGRITQLVSSIVDPQYASPEGRINESAALAIAKQVFAKTLGRANPNMETVVPPTLYYYVVSAQLELVPMYTFVLQSDGPPAFVKVNAITGTATVEPTGTPAVSDVGDE